MKNVILKSNQKIQFTLLCTLLIFPLTPRVIESILMILLAFSALIYLIFEGQGCWNKIKTKQLLILSSIFIVFGFSMIYSNNHVMGFNYIKKLLPIVVFPIVFLSNKNSHIQSFKLEKLLTFYLIGLFFILFVISLFFFKSIYIDKIGTLRLRDIVENFTDVHGTYMSMWVGFGVLIILHKSHFFLKNKLNLVMGFLLLCFLLHWLLLLKARMPFFATVFLSLIFLALTFKISFKKIAILVCGFLTVLIIVFNKDISIKIDTLTNYKDSIPAGKYENLWPYISNEDIRSGIYHCSFQIIKSNLFFGVGVGDVDDLLQKCYDSDFYYTDIFIRKKYNSHSQYLLVLLSSGLLGLIVYLYLFTYLFRYSIQKNFYLYSIFLIYICLCFSFENILSRHDGVLFFSLFNTLFFFTEKEKKVL